MNNNLLEHLVANLTDRVADLEQDLHMQKRKLRCVEDKATDQYVAFLRKELAEPKDNPQDATAYIENLHKPTQG